MTHGSEGARRSGHARWGLLALAVAPVLALALAGQQTPREKAAAEAWRKDVEPVVRKYCASCHTGKAAAAGLNLSQAKGIAAVTANAAAWRKVRARVHAQTMPPAGSPKPTATQRNAFLKGLDAALALAPAKPIAPGRVTMRRLNRNEYNRTVQDLFYGMPFSPADDFPSDDVGNGFDNQGDVLTLSPLLMEKYLAAAESIVEQAIALPRNQTRRYDVDRLRTDNGRHLETSVGMFAASKTWAEVDVEHAGAYKVRVLAFAQQAGPEVARMSLTVGQGRVAIFDVQAVGEPAAYEAPIQLAKGKVDIGVAFLNDYYQPNDPNPANRDRNLYVHAIELLGPLGPDPALSQAHRQILFETPDSREPLGAARRILTRFARRAYRRPVSTSEVERLVRFVEMALKDGEPFERGIRTALTAVLVSPHFLYRIEPEPPKGGVRALTAHELASRLSYFLWASMPDEALAAKADSGALLDRAVLKAEAMRLVQSAKADGFVEDFAGQWLQLRKLDSVSPDPELFPTFDDRLRAAMRRESELFFAHVLRQNRPIAELVGAPYTFVNETLARHYGIGGVSGPEFRKVDAKGRGGILTMASVLTVTSNPNRTSPVKRGKWVLEQVLGAPPPPPPPDVGVIEGDTDKVPSKTIRERLAKHRSKPACAICHVEMDAIGMAFESFDATGRIRTHDGAFPIETAGTLADGSRFKDLVELRALLLRREASFVRAFAEKVFVFALGRGIEPADAPALEAIVRSTQANGGRIGDLILAIVTSPAFTQKQADKRT